MKKLLYFLLAIIYCAVLGNCEKQRKNEQEVPPLQTYSTEPIVSGTETAEEKKDGFPILFSLNGLYGYLDGQLQIIIPPIYRRGYNYTEHGYARVYYEKNDLSEGRILDRKGNIVFNARGGDLYLVYDDIINYRPKGEQFYRIMRFRDNTVIADGQGSSGGPVNNDIIIMVSNEYGERFFIDSSGKRILSNLTIHRLSRNFREERAVVYEGETGISASLT